MALPADVTEALEERRIDSNAIPRSMPPAFYRDPAMLAHEIDALFVGGWICVGRADVIPEAGDYFSLEIFDEPLVVVRQRDGDVVALSNVCRHRGSQIVSGNGHARRGLVCPYHQWAYGLDGQLLGAPLVEDCPGFDASRCSLPRFLTVNWMGWIFVNLDGQANDFNAEIEGLNAYVRNYHPEEMRIAGGDTEAWSLNWKCLAENFMEGYHLTPVHRKTLHPITPTRLCRKIPGGKGYTGYKSHYNPSYNGRTEVHPDMTEEECALSMMVWIYPSFVAAISPNSAVYMSITPTGPEALQTRWGVIARQSTFASGESDARFEFAKSFNVEDRERLLDVQKGLRSRFATRGFLAPPDFEGTVWDFYGYYASSRSRWQ